MPEQTILSGTLIAPDGLNSAGIKVQAFDRDLPSLERRTGKSPQLLGEAIADNEGRFQITYTREQFQNGEGISPNRRLQDKNADLSFLVFDGNEQAVAIKYIKALDRKYGPDQIIFNAPTPFEINIFLAGAEAASNSEYENLLALIAPVVADLPLTELAEDDLAFLSNELGLEQQPELQQRIEWLRRCALMSQESHLPIEAFYGWGRKDLPTRLTELAGLAVTDLPVVLEKLAGLTDDALRAALQAAVAENIIPARMRERADALAHAVRRPALKQVTVVIRLEREPTGEPLVGYTVAAFDADANNRDLGTDVTDALGEFAIAYFADPGAIDVERNLRFQVRGPDIAEAIEVNERVRPNADEAVGIRISPSAAPPTLRQLRGDGRIEVTDAILETLEQKHRIRSLADIRRHGGLGRSAELRALDSGVTRRLDALADLDRLSNDLNETTVLLKLRYDSVAAVADTPRSEFMAAFAVDRIGGGERPAIGPRRAAELHVMAQAQTELFRQMFAGLAADFSNGIQPETGVTAGDYFPPFPPESAHA